MAYESQDKMVSHPDHYQAKNGMEVINVIEAFTEGLNGIEATDTGNIIKYACRWKNKNGIQDLEKIIWYAQHLVDHLKAKDASGNTFKLEELHSIDGLVSFVTDIREIPEVDASKNTKAPEGHLVKVVHIDYKGKEKTQKGTYYFRTYDDVKIGDIVECDTKNGCVLGKIVKTINDISIEEYIEDAVYDRHIKSCRKRVGA